MDTLPFPLPIAPPRAHDQKHREDTRAFSHKLFADFYRFPIQRARALLETKPADFWIRKGEERALALFHAAAERVPAYKVFLKTHKLSSRSIRTVADFRHVPWVDKDNYLRKYSLSELSWDGQLHHSQITSVSSGSSGAPFYWPRGSLLEVETAYVQEMYLVSIFEVDRLPTLYVDAFAMGMYIAGPVILNSALRVAQKGHPMTVVTPGLEIEDVLRVISGLAKYHRQIVLAGYPPFIKDILDAAEERGLDWKRVHVRFLLAGEGFSESWREYVAELVGQKKLAVDFINIYGTADASIVGHETPTSIVIRRLAGSSPMTFSSLFPGEQAGRLPTLVQYYPTLKYFESLDGELLFSATAGIPLVRYNIHDRGGVFSWDDALTRADVGGNTKLAQLLAVARYTRKPWRLPFVYVFGKSDFTVTLYGLNVYPENVKTALEDPSVRRLVTGRFTMSTEYRRQSPDQYLLVNVELAERVRPTSFLKRHISSVLVKTLRRVNAEYGKLYTSIGGRARPSVRLFKKGSSRQFVRGIKQGWVQRRSSS